jgi:hypothetical protein
MVNIKKEGIIYYASALFMYYFDIYRRNFQPKKYDDFKPTNSDEKERGKFVFVSVQKRGEDDMVKLNDILFRS